MWRRAGATVGGWALVSKAHTADRRVRERYLLPLHSQLVTTAAMLLPLADALPPPMCVSCGCKREVSGRD